MSQPHLRLDLRSSSQANTHARRALSGLFDRWGLDDPRWRVAVSLIATELVSNAVRHGGGCLSLDVSSRDGRLTVAAVDASRTPPRRRPPDDEGGRGMHIIAALTEAWGVEPHGDGKRVWARLHPYPYLPTHAAGG